MSQRQSRRPLGLLMIVVILALVVGGVVQQRTDASTTPRNELAARLDVAKEPNRFALHYNRGGTRVLDCIAVNLRYTARVDTDAKRMIVTTAGLNAATVIVEPSEVLLRRTLFQNPPGRSEWLSVPRPLAASARSTLTDVLGVDLAADVTSPRLPASGTELARAALNIARSVQRLAVSQVNGDSSEGYRIRVTRQGFERDAKTLPGQPTDSMPVLDVWIDADNEVRRVTINTETRDGTPGPAEDGWTVDFETTQSIQRPTIASSSPLTPGDLAQLEAVKPQCELPVGADDA